MASYANVSGAVHGVVVQTKVIQGDVHLPPRATVVVPRQLPRTIEVVGRDTELAVMDRLLDGSGRVVVINGIAGVGKTALCLHWARSATARFPDGQLYVDLLGFHPDQPPMSTSQAVRRFLDGLGVPRDQVPDSTESQVDLYRSIVAGRRLLVVLDNARDVEQVRSLLPSGTDSAGIITSRTELVGLTVRDDVQRIGLGLLSAESSARVLLDRLGPETVSPELARLLAAPCGGLPLALGVVAGRAAHRDGVSVSALADELASTTRRLDVLDTGDPHTTVRSVLSWSYFALSPPARTLFRLLALPGHTDISVSAAASLTSVPPESARNVLAELAGVNMVEECSPGRFQFHDLLREYSTETRTREIPAQARDHALLRLLDGYLHTTHALDQILNPHRLPITLLAAASGAAVGVLTDYDSATGWAHREHAAMISALHVAAAHGFARHVWQLAWCLVTYQRRFSHIAERETVQRLALTATQTLGDPLAEAKISRVLAKSLVGTARDAEAELLQRRAAALFNELGAASEEADSLLALSRIHQRRDLGLAARNAERALRLARRAGNQNLTAAALIVLAGYDLKRADPARAKQRCRAALASFRSIRNREGEASALRVLGSTALLQGHHDDAKASYQESLEIDIALGDHFYAAVVLSRLGDTHLATGETSAAEAAWLRSMALFNGLGRSEVSEVAEKLNRHCPIGRT